jgi:serine/threonine protein kinase
MHDLLGTRLGQYEIKEHIADGGMASVYLARQASMNRNVAIKILPGKFTRDESFHERFYREVEVIAQLQHPHILPVYDFGTHDNLPYIVMAYLGGGTLADRLRDGDMSLDNILRTAGQIAGALDFAHSKGIIHRDLKPGNVLLDEQGNAYLADFGLAKILESESNITQMSIVGTPAYMAPEQAQSAEMTSAVDVYALGITLYEMLTGNVPYQGPSAPAVIIAHIQKPVPSILADRPDLPEAIEPVIERALAKSVDERYSAAGELMTDVRAALQGTAPAETTTAPQSPQPALLMTNVLGHVIFVDNQCLNLLKRHQHEARNIMGKPIHEVLGASTPLTKQLMDAIRAKGQVDSIELEITDSRGHLQPVICSGLATLDDRDEFVGADITLLPLPKAPDAPPSSKFATAQPFINTQESSYLQAYFISQIEALYQLAANWGGKRVANHFESIINETGRRNVWTVHMEKGKIEVELKQSDIDMYKALLARGLGYAAHILGKKQVIKEMEYVNKNTPPYVLSFVQSLGLDELYNEILD